MAKTFYTEWEIVELSKRGITSLTVNDDVVLTDLAREMAQKRGVRLVRETNVHPTDNGNAELIRRVRAAVLSRLNGQVDPVLLDAVITRVVNSMK